MKIKKMKPLKHQEKYIKGYKDKELVVHEGGTGKTVCGALWLKDNRDSDALVICPKRIVKKWEETLNNWGTRATVVSKENFKKLSPKKWSALVVDEADEFASPLFTKARSALSTSLYNLIQEFPEMPILLCTATPVRSNPWNLHTLLCFRGIYIPWKDWRDRFFSLEKRPYLARLAWLPKPDWRIGMRPILEKYADIVLLKDCIDELPSIQENIIKIESPKFEKNIEWEASAAFSAEHRNEQKNKPTKILEIGKKYRKILVVAYYVEQVEQLYKELSKNRLTYMVHGGVKDQEKILKEANEVDECFLIIQASLGAGFDADSFSCIIFASMSNKVRDFVQMKYRVRRIHNLHPVVYNYLIGGRCDKSVLKTIQLGKDFVPSEWDDNTTQITEDIQEEGSED